MRQHLTVSSESHGLGEICVLCVFAMCFGCAFLSFSGGKIVCVRELSRSLLCATICFPSLSPGSGRFTMCRSREVYSSASTSTSKGVGVQFPICLKASSCGLGSFSSVIYIVPACMDVVVDYAVAVPQ